MIFRSVLSDLIRHPIRHPIRSKSSLIDFRLLHRPPRFIYILFYFFYYFMIFNFYLLYYIFIFYICIQQSTMGDNHPHLRRGQSVAIIRYFPFNQFKCIVSYVSLHCIGTVVVFQNKCCGVKEKGKEKLRSCSIHYMYTPAGRGQDQL